MRIGAYLETSFLATVVRWRYQRTISIKDTQSILDPLNMTATCQPAAGPSSRREWYSANQCWFPLLADGPEAS
jgi:hypothetical protein